MKKLLLLVMLLVVCCGVGLGQSQGCTLYAIDKDIVCEEESLCELTLNCTTKSFTVPVGCTNQHSIKAYTTCSGTHPAHCASCVKIFTSGGTLVASVDTDDECNDADYCDVVTWTPTAGNYVMHVCLIPCNEVDIDPCCRGENGCQAWGIVSVGTLSCP